MPKTKTIVPITHPSTGEAVAAGADITLSDEEYAALRAAGSVEASPAEVKKNATPEATGNYSERTGREDVGGQPAEPSREEKKKG